MKDTLKETLWKVYEKVHKVLDQLEALGLVNPVGNRDELTERLPNVFKKWGALGNSTLDISFATREGFILYFTLTFFYDTYSYGRTSFSTSLIIHPPKGSPIGLSGSVSLLTVEGFMLSMEPGNIQIEFNDAPEVPLEIYTKGEA